MHSLKMCFKFFMNMCLLIGTIRCSYGLSLPLPKDMEEEYMGEVTIDFKKDGERLRRSADGVSIPAKTIEVTFPFKNRQVDLHLKRMDEQSANVPVFAANDRGEIVRQYIQDKNNVFYYQDKNKFAAFYVETTDNALCMFGSFEDKSNEYFLEPKEKNCDPESFGVFKIMMAKNKNITYHDSIPMDNTQRRYKVTPPGAPVPEDLVRRKRAVPEYKIETLLVVDFSVYNYWYTQSTKVTSDEKDKDAKFNIRQYYAWVINGMDVRYKNIQTSTYTISVVFAGIYIADNPSKSTFTENHKDSSVPTQVESTAVLLDVTSWVNSNTAGLPSHDHAMMFSRYDFTRSGSNGVAGLAWGSEMCTNRSVTIVEDHFNFDIMTVAAHELGHSLGARHDGSGNACSSSDSFIMASLSTIVDNTNPWKFSTCSTTYFTTYISLNSGSSGNCMVTLNAGFDPTALNHYTSLPGQVFDPDAICKHVLGPISSFCMFAYNNNYTSICTTLWCRKTDGSGGCKSIAGADGLHCGNKKWCKSGICTYDDCAPSGDESCLYGDRSGEVVLIINNAEKTCSQVASESHLCYNVGVSEKCCQTCGQIYTGRQGCEYGDKAQGCTSNFCSIYPEICCGTCYSGTSAVSVPETTTQNLCKTTTIQTTSTITTSTTEQQTITTTVQPTTTLMSTATEPATTTTEITQTTTEPIITSTEQTTIITESLTTTTELIPTTREITSTEPTTTTTKLTTEPTTTTTEQTTTTTQQSTTEPILTTTESTTSTEPTKTITGLKTDTTELLTTTIESTTTTTEPTPVTIESTTNTIEMTSITSELTTSVEQTSTNNEPKTTNADPTTTILGKTTISREPTTTAMPATITTIQTITFAESTESITEPTTITTEPTTTNILDLTTTFMEPKTYTNEPMTTNAKPTTSIIGPTTTTTKSTTISGELTTVSGPTTNSTKPSITATESTTATTEPITTTDPTTATEPTIKTTEPTTTTKPITTTEPTITKEPTTVTETTTITEPTTVTELTTTTRETTTTTEPTTVTELTTTTWETTTTTEPTTTTKPITTTEPTITTEPTTVTELTTTTTKPTTTTTDPTTVTELTTTTTEPTTASAELRTAIIEITTFPEQRTMEQATSKKLTSTIISSLTSSTKTTLLPTTSTSATTTKLAVLAKTTATLIGSNEIRFKFVIRLVIVITEDLTVSAQYSIVMIRVETALTELYRRRLGSRFKRCRVKRVRSGSLIVDYYVITDDQPTSASDVVSVAKDLVSGKENVTYDGQAAPVSSAAFRDWSGTNVNISSATTGCDLLESSSPCGLENKCTEGTSGPYCRKFVSDNDTQMLIIIGAVIGSFCLLVITAMVLALCICKNQRKEKGGSRYGIDNATMTPGDGLYNGRLHYENDGIRTYNFSDMGSPFCGKRWYPGYNEMAPNGTWHQQPIINMKYLIPRPKYKTCTNF